MISCNILVGVCTARPFKDKRDACRTTWLSCPADGIECRFFAGGGEPLTDEPDVVALEAPDDYDGLPAKGLAFYRWALANSDFRWLFKCDDDTYTRLPRLHELCLPDADLVGDKHLRRYGFPSGGAGYLMRREVVQAIVDHAAEVPPTGPEDVIFGNLVGRLGFRMVYSPRLRCKWHTVPAPKNSLVTAHHCTPDYLQRIHSGFVPRAAVHQLWLGDALPDSMRPWCESMRTFAGMVGMDYRLDGWEELRKAYRGTTTLAILQAAWQAVPNGTTASLISDWYRLRILADKGGIYADADFHFDGTAPTWRPTADVALFNEHVRGVQYNTALTWCNGERGQEACKAMVEAVERRLLDVLGDPAAPHFASRYVAAVRLDKEGEHSFSQLISPRYLREAVLPQITAAGYTVEAIPLTVASNTWTRNLLRCTWPPLWHHGSNTWRVRDGWQAAADNAAKLAEDAGGECLHQIWLGGALPDKYRQWCESMERLAIAKGMRYKLWTQEELEARYAAAPVQGIFRRGKGLVPDSTLYGLASDWYRYALMADYGGIYADTDMHAQNIPDVVAYRPSADIEFSNEGKDGSLACIGLIWCNGKRGQDAARVLVEEATHRLLESLPPDAPDFGVRLVNIARQDRCVSGIARYGIGPVALRTVLIPAMRAAGYTCRAVERPLEADRRYLPTAWLLHCSAAAWYNRQTDWQGLEVLARAADAAYRERKQAAEREAAELERRQAAYAARMAALPCHLRPQGRCALPLRRKATAAPDTATTGAATVQAGKPVPPMVPPLPVLNIPKGTRRIVIFSNVTRNFPAFQLQRGDFCIHMNHACHLAEARKVAGTSHAVLVRHGRNDKTKRRIWFTPYERSVEGADQIVFFNDDNPCKRTAWWKEYTDTNPGKVPTSGWIMANLMRAMAPHLPLYLLGFDPGVDYGTPVYRGHAWQYERTWYIEKGFTLLKPKK